MLILPFLTPEPLSLPAAGHSRQAKQFSPTKIRVSEPIVFFFYFLLDEKVNKESRQNNATTRPAKS
jgi:hypothetical protein